MLPSKVVRNKAGRPVLLVLAALIFAGCSGQSSQSPDASIENAATGTADYYLQQMRQSADDSRLSWQLLAIRALLKEGKTDAAAKLLDQLPRKRSARQQQEIRLLQAQYQTMTNHASAARSLLLQIDASALSPHQQSRYYPLVIASQQGAPSLTLLRAYIAQQPLLNDPDDKQKNIDATWQTLTRMNQQQVDRLVINANENILQGWLDLRNTWITNRSDPGMLKAGISDWQTRYPQNPAAKMLPAALSNEQNFQTVSSGKIALLLPLNGQAKVFSDAIRQGFTDAKNGTLPTAPEQNQPVAQDQTPDARPAADSPPAGTETRPPETTEDEAAPQPDARTWPQNSTVQIQTAAPSAAARVELYDTSSQPLDQLLAKAQQDGATFVVGPLLKNNVKVLVKISTMLNVLALNEPEQIENQPNICYFALSPEDEAHDAAHHMWQQGKRQPLLLLPRSELGDRVSNAFALEWQQLGGGTVLQQRFGSAGELKQKINNETGIRLSGTPVTAQQPQGVSVAGLNFPAPVTEAAALSDGNPDSVYIVATPGELLLIKPMIAMRTSSRDNLAMYASSRSYQAGADDDFRREMEGLQFSDAPLISGANPTLLAQAARRFNNDYSLVRLYAMGIDAWTLANHFNQIRQQPDFRLQGYSGMLSTTQDCVINRKLLWNQYRQGQIVPVS